VSRSSVALFAQLEGDFMFDPAISRQKAAYVHLRVSDPGLAGGISRNESSLAASE
jgi:hypothetical protein